VFGKLLDEFMAFLVKYSGKIEKITEKLRVGKVVQAGERSIPVVGKVAERTVFAPSRRVITTAFGTAAGVGPLATGVAVKGGIGAAKGAGREGSAEAREEGPLFGKSGIGGDQSVEDTRKNLDI
jgi:hypothetical protein